MRRGRAPSREPSGSGGPQWDDPNGQLPGTGIPGHFMALVLTTLRRNMQLKDPRHYMHVDGRRKTVLTVLRGVHSLMFVMHLSAMTMLLPLAQMPIQNGGTGMKTMLWDINFILN